MWYSLPSGKERTEAKRIWEAAHPPLNLSDDAKDKFKTACRHFQIVEFPFDKFNYKFKNGMLQLQLISDTAKGYSISLGLKDRKRFKDIIDKILENINDVHNSN
jgi:hypothetical protein